LIPLVIALGIAGGYIISRPAIAEQEYEAWKKTLAPPAAPPPPAAPETKQELTTWTPEQERARYRELWDAWLKQAIPAPPEQPKGEEPLMWIYAAVAVAAVSFALLMRRSS
jgi:predicted Zn-dependent peptidase